MSSFLRRPLLCLLLVTLPLQGMASLALGQCAHRAGGDGRGGEATEPAAPSAHPCCLDERQESSPAPCSQCADCVHCSGGGVMGLIPASIPVPGLVARLPRAIEPDSFLPSFARPFLRPPRLG